MLEVEVGLGDVVAVGSLGVALAVEDTEGGANGVALADVGAAGVAVAEVLLPVSPRTIGALLGTPPPEQAVRSNAPSPADTANVAPKLVDLATGSLPMLSSFSTLGDCPPSSRPQ